MCWEGRCPEGHLSGGANFLLSGPVSTVLFVEPTACRAADLAAANMFPCLNDDGLNGGAGADELH